MFMLFPRQCREAGWGGGARSGNSISACKLLHKLAKTATSPSSGTHTPHFVSRIVRIVLDAKLELQIIG